MRRRHTRKRKPLCRCGECASCHKRAARPSRSLAAYIWRKELGIKHPNPRRRRHTRRRARPKAKTTSAQALQIIRRAYGHDPRGPVSWNPRPRRHRRMKVRGQHRRARRHLARLLGGRSKRGLSGRYLKRSGRYKGKMGRLLRSFGRGSVRGR